MSPTFSSLLLAAGIVVAMSSCSVFKKDEPAPAQEPYPAATAYGAGTTGAPATTPAYGAPGATDTAGGYTAPNYNQPYVQPSNPPAGPGYAGIYDNPAGSTGAARPGTAATGGGRPYKIMPGDNLTKIGKRFNVGVAELKRANNLTNDTIVEGRTLIIP